MSIKQLSVLFYLSILQTFAPHVTSVQYCDCSVHWRLFGTSGDYISTVGDTVSTVGGLLQYCRGCSVQWGSFSTVEDSFRTVEVVQYSGG